MSRYDEDLYENPFFVELEKHSADLFGKATHNRWLICIPKFSLVVKEKLGRNDFEDHILVPDPDHDGRFTSVSNHHLTIQGVHINLGAGFKDFKQIEILFEEVFYNSQDESYRVLCVGDFFNRESQVSTAEDDSVWAKPPTTYDECLRILWSRAGSSKTRENVDKALLAYCSAYQKYEGDSITSLADLVSGQITGAMQIILKDQNIRRSVANNEVYMVNLKVAAEMYFMNATHKHLFSTITACVKADDALVNKMTRNLTEVRLHHLGVRRELEENIPMARKELSSLNQFSTPLGRLMRLKRVMTALTKPRQNSDLVMTTDDFLPLLIYLIIKSQINNWNANLMYMKYFHQASVADSDILSFYLTTTEAALDYIKRGEIKIENSQASPQKVAKPVGGSEPSGFMRQASGGGTTAKSKFFQYVQYGDEAAVTLMLKKPNKDADDVLSQLCHPLCSCDKCSELVAKSKISAREVSTLSRDDMGRTALHIAAFYGQAGLIDILVKNGSLADASDYLGCTPLHLACQKGFQNIILLLVHFGSDIGALDNEGNTPLHLCAKNGHEDCVKAILFLDILKSKLNVNAQNDMGDTPLHMAAKWGYEGIVKFLLETEADARTRNRKRQTPLSLAQNLTIKRMLQSAYDDPPPIVVRHQAPKKESKASKKSSQQVKRTSKSSKSSKSSKLASPSSSSSTPASSSTSPPASSKQTTQPQSPAPTPDKKTPMGFDIVDIRPARPPKELIDNSSSKMMAPKTTVVASLDRIDPRQVDKLFTAISNKDIELVKFYLGWVDSPDVDDEGSPREPGALCHPLCQCSRCQPIQKMSSNTNLHVNCCNKKGFTPLHIAIIENFTEAFRLFLRKGAGVNAQTHRDITPLHLACFHSSTEMVEMLVRRGADVNLEDQYGEIPLHLAAAKNNVEIVQILIQHNSTVNLVNVDGNTPLHRAAASHAVESLELLLENGADPNIANKNNLLPYNVTKNKDIQELLLAKQAQMQKKMAAITEMQKKPQDDTQLNERISKLQSMLTTLEGRDLRAWQDLGESIRSFPAQHSLKRSKTFDHSEPILDTPQLKLSLSIRHFDKAKTLKKQNTVDKSLPYLKPFSHSLSIQHFDSGTLKHVDPVDKSSPMHLLSLTQSFSSYSNYLDTPVEGKELSFSSCDNSEAQGEEDTCDSVDSAEEESNETHEDNQKSPTNKECETEKNHETVEHKSDIVNTNNECETEKNHETVEHESDIVDHGRDLEEIQTEDNPTIADVEGQETEINLDTQEAKCDNNDYDKDTKEIQVDSSEKYVKNCEGEMKRSDNGDGNDQNEETKNELTDAETSDTVNTDCLDVAKSRDCPDHGDINRELGDKPTDNSENNCDRLELGQGDGDQCNSLVCDRDVDKSGCGEETRTDNASVNNNECASQVPCEMDQDSQLVNTSDKQETAD